MGETFVKTLIGESTQLALTLWVCVIKLKLLFTNWTLVFYLYF